jgi:hypothetical protein
MPHKNPKGHGAKLLADITPCVDVMLISVIRGERMSAGLNSLGGVLWRTTSFSNGPKRKE